MAVTEGKLRIKYSDAAGSRADVVYGDVPTSILDVSTDPRQQPVVEYQGGAPQREHDLIIIALKGKTAGDFDSGSTIQIPVTIRSTTTGVIRDTFLELEDFTDMEGAAVSATNIDYATTFTDVLKYTVDPQEEVKLGHRFAENSRVYVALVVT